MRQLAPIFLNQGLSLILGVAGIKLIAAFVPPEVNGPYTLFLTLIQLGAIVTHSGLINHITRYWQREQSRCRVYARFIWGRTWLASIPLAGLLAVLLPLAIRPASLHGWLGVLALLWISNIGFCFWTLANVALNANERHWCYLGLGGLGNGTRAVLPGVMAWLGGGALIWVCSGFALHAGMMALVVCILYLRLGVKPAITPGLRQPWMEELKRFGRPFILIGVGGWALQSADRWVVSIFFGDAMAGQFGMATSMASVIPTMAASSLMQWSFPKIFRKADQAQTADDWIRLRRDCDRIALLFLGVALLGLLLLWWLGPWLVPWLITPRYERSLRLVIPAGAGFAVLPLTQFFFLLLQGQHNSASIVRIMLMVALAKTAGSCLAAWISWPFLMGWLALSLLVCGGLGRFLVFRAAASGQTMAPSRGLS
jgi:O-antigen/teichoic acid export membrane protein